MTQAKGTTSKHAVFCRGVTKSYRTGSQTVHALRGVDLEAERGELLMLVGPSGCGKTTLISVLAGILDRDGGECEVLGTDPSALVGGRKTKWRSLNIGFVFQQFNLLPTLSARENTAVPLLIQGTSRAEAIGRAEEMLDAVGLGDRGQSMPSELSGGQQQRVAIARALVHEPSLIVCDEPTSALDHETGGRVMSLMRQVAMAAGRSLIIVTHDQRIFEYADRIARLDDGHVISVEQGASASKDKPSPRLESAAV